VRADEVVLLAGRVLDEPGGERARLLVGVRIDAKYVRAALRAGDRGGVGNGRYQDAFVALGHLADRERGARIDRAGEEIDLVLLQELLCLADGNGRVGLLVLEQ